MFNNHHHKHIIKNLSRVETEGKFPNLVKIRAFPLKLGVRKSALTILFCISLSGTKKQKQKRPES
uniref:Uncharacterized protein n=1 Tax=Bos indicus x Bos taurus TaxID=30522 RepID=A0A4W2DAC2_BOBOX